MRVSKSSSLEVGVGGSGSGGGSDSLALMMKERRGLLGVRDEEEGWERFGNGSDGESDEMVAIFELLVG